MSSFNKLFGGGALLACVLLGGCSDIYFDRRDTIALSAGDAQASNSVAQMVDPWPPYSANKNIAFNGEKMQTAVERYRMNRVIQPVNATTSSVPYAQAQQAAAAPPVAVAAPPPPPPPPPSFAAGTPVQVSAPSAGSTAAAPPASPPAQ